MQKLAQYLLAWCQHFIKYNKKSIIFFSKAISAAEFSDKIKLKSE